MKEAVEGVDFGIGSLEFGESFFLRVRLLGGGFFWGEPIRGLGIW